MLIGNILKSDHPEIYQKLMRITMEQNSQLINQLEYREQPEFEEDDYNFRRIRNMMTRKKAVKL